MMEKEGVKRPKIRKKKVQRVSEEEHELEDHADSYSKDSMEAEAEKYMPKKKNLQIEVIEHPEANSKPEQIAKGDGSVVDTDPNQYSEQEPDYRRGTGNEEFEGEYEEEEEEAEPQQNHEQHRYKSFGDQTPHSDEEHEIEEPEHRKFDQEGLNSKISNNLMQEFMQNKEEFNKTTKLSKQDQQPSFEGNDQYTEEIEQTEESKIDDDLVERQAREAEELLEEAQKTMQEEEQDPSEEEEGEEDEIEDIAKKAKENRIYELNPEEEEEEDEDNKENYDGTTKFELNYTVGRIEDGSAILISKDHNLIEIPL